MELKARFPSHAPNASGRVDPNSFIHFLSGRLIERSVVTSDVGQNQMWVAQSIALGEHNVLLNSAGHGAMGFSLPAAIGAYFADESRHVVCISGDGGIQMNIQELQTVVKERVPLTIIIMNNHSLGMVRCYHEKWFKERMYGTVIGFSSPDYGKIADAYGLGYIKLESEADYSQLMSLPPNTARIIEVDLDTYAPLRPEPAPSKPVYDQWPLIDRELFKQIVEDLLDAQG